MKRVVCIKGLFKSTYGRNAFLKNRQYDVLREDDMIWVRDEMNNEFSFSPDSTDPVYYAFSEYFRPSR